MKTDAFVLDMGLLYFEPARSHDFAFQDKMLECTSLCTKDASYVGRCNMFGKLRFWRSREYEFTDTGQESRTGERINDFHPLMFISRYI